MVSPWMTDESDLKSVVSQISSLGACGELKLVPRSIDHLFDPPIFRDRNYALSKYLRESNIVTASAVAEAIYQCQVKGGTDVEPS